MDAQNETFFDAHPDPLWIYDVETLRFLAVNDAAVAFYGWSRDEFLTMDLSMVRPPEDLPRLMAAVQASLAGRPDDDPFRHRTKSGALVHVSVSTRPTTFAGRPAMIAAVRDVTRLVALEAEKSALLDREKAARTRADTLARQFQALFNRVPERMMVVDPERFEVIAVSDAFLETARVTRAALIGRSIDTPMDPGEDPARLAAANRLRASLRRVASTGEVDVIPIQSVATSDRDAAAPQLWSVVNTPVKDETGRVVQIFHQIEDVTAPFDRATSGGDPGDNRNKAAVADPLRAVLRRADLLHLDNMRLERERAEMQTAQVAFGLATWRIDPETGALVVSDSAHALLGTDPATFGGHFDDYLALVHPEDRPAFLERRAAFLASDDSHYRIRQRIIRPSDGEIRWVDGVSERIRDADGRQIFVGMIQDVTEREQARIALERATHLIGIAGRMARLGGWSVDPATGEVVWTEQTAAIHGRPGVTVTTLDEVNRHIHEAHREVVEELFGTLMQKGTPVDAVFRIRTAQGEPVWVRVVGNPVQDEAGRIVRLEGALQDVSEMIEARDRAANLADNLARTLESISDGFFTLDADFRFTFVNSRAQDLLQRPRDVMLGRGHFEVFPDGLGSEVEVSYRRAMREKRTVRFQRHSVRLGKWFDATVYPTSDGLAVYFQDVTADRERQSQMRLLENALSRLSDIVLITDGEPVIGPDGPRIVYVNDAFERRTGYAADEVIGKTPRILQGPGTDRAELRRIREALLAWQPVRSELLNYTKAGKPFWLELDIVPIADESGWYTHWVAVERDITERREAEQALRISNERFRLVSLATRDVIWDWNFQTGVLWWSDALRDVFGHDPESDLTGAEQWSGFIHPADRDGVLKRFFAAVDGTASNWHDEYRMMTAGGATRHVADRGFLIRDAEGRAVRMVGSISDMTEQRELNEKLRQSQKLEAVGQLTGGVAHDFNNLLTVILGNAELLTEGLPRDHKLRMMAEMTATAAERGAELTNRLLAFARRQALEPRVINLSRVVSGMEGMIRRTVSEAIDIEFVQSAGLWPAEVDPGQLEVALLNLVINARDAMPDGGRLTIETANSRLDDSYADLNVDITPGQYVMVSVSDTGFGMTPEVVARAFDPFFTTKEVGKGSGLGLSMVYGFARQSNGFAKIYSEPGLGTTVKLYFPRARAAGGAVPAEAADAPALGGREHILVVEDDRLVREHVVLQLVALGYRVTQASNGPEALELIRQNDGFDLLFTDVVMPAGMSGRELAREALLVRPGLKVLFTSGYTENSIVHHGRLDNGVQLLQKPYRRVDLATKLRRVLDNRD